ncbi:GerAB/ArcD/ProY family transporter [Brevibacillus dissolubilis]|uniref:GerAB/ArcD/ProY family transporter n=1 Tax=Brevibacillus dissolubilis TaxID=1844116 RepID=UPI001117A90D|nr:endospore germination permease [Brevibacillus dissolubilis]
MVIKSYTPSISAKQLFLFIVSSRVAVMTIFLPVIGNSNAKDAWLSSILAGVMGLAVTWIIVTLARIHPNQTLVQICSSLLGKWLGGVFIVIFLWFFLHISIITVRQFAEILNNALMPETPVPFFILYIEMAVAFSVYRGLEAILRANTITLAVSLNAIFMILLFVAKEIHINTLLPVLEEGWMPVIMGSVVPLAWHGEIILIPMLYPYVSDKEKVLRYSMFATLMNTLILVLLAIFVVGIFGPDEALNLTFPVFSLARMVSIADFLERLEALMVAVCMSMLFMKSCIYLYSGVIGVGQWLELKSYRFLIIPMVTLSMILSHTSFQSISEIKHFLTPELFGGYALTINTLLPTLLLVLSILQKRKKSR